MTVAICPILGQMAGQMTVAICPAKCHLVSFVVSQSNTTPLVSLVEGAFLTVNAALYSLSIVANAVRCIRKHLPSLQSIVLHAASGSAIRIVRYTNTHYGKVY